MIDRSAPFNARGAGPEVLKVVVLPRLLKEDVHDEVAVIHEDPGCILEAFDPHRRKSMRLLDTPFDLFDQRAHVSPVGCARDDKRIDHPKKLRHGQDNGVLSELVVGRMGCRGSGWREVDMDVQPWAQWSTSRIPTVRPKKQTKMPMQNAAQRRRVLRAIACSARRSARSLASLGAGRGEIVAGVTSVTSAGRALICR